MNHVKTLSDTNEHMLRVALLNPAEASQAADGATQQHQKQQLLTKLSSV